MKNTKENRIKLAAQIIGDKKVYDSWQNETILSFIKEAQEGLITVDDMVKFAKVCRIELDTEGLE